MSGFAVELPAFTGPFRVLSDLILQQKVDVCDVAIGSITDAFLAHVKDVDAWSLDEATLFLAICAVLLELKVGRLMPRHEVLDEEDLLGISPDLAYARSIELLAIRRVALDLAARMEEEAMSFPRLAGPPPEFEFIECPPSTSCCQCERRCVQQDVVDDHGLADDTRRLDVVLATETNAGRDRGAACTDPPQELQGPGRRR